LVPPSQRQVDAKPEPSALTQDGHNPQDCRGDAHHGHHIENHDPELIRRHWQRVKNVNFPIDLIAENHSGVDLTRTVIFTWITVNGQGTAVSL
jgi:hypothetical protein